MHFSNAASRRDRNLELGKYVRPLTAPVSDSHQELSHAELSLWTLSGWEGLGSVRQRTSRRGKRYKSVRERGTSSGQSGTAPLSAPGRAVY